MRKLRRTAIWILSTLAIMLPLQFLIPTVAQAATFTPLTLKNGWTGAPFGTASPAVASISGAPAPLSSAKPALAAPTAAASCRRE